MFKYAFVYHKRFSRDVSYIIVKAWTIRGAWKKFFKNFSNPEQYIVDFVFKGGLING